MKRSIIILTAVLLLLQLCSSLWALPTTAYEAEMVVTGWLKAGPQPLDTALGQQVMRVETFADDYGKPVYYIVYLQPSGFVIVSADDLVEPIIGFADDGAYDPTLKNPLGALVTNDLNMRITAVRSTFGPLAMTPQAAVTETQKKWNYLISLAETSNGGFGLMSNLPVSRERLSKVLVAPMIQSEWGQGEYYNSYNEPLAFYNYYTPQLVDNKISFIEGHEDNYPCGCVATAMAQLMRYHRHPNEPVEPNTFIISVEEQTTERSLLRGEGSDGAYNWDDMVFRPRSSTPDENRRAIGALCHDAGVSVNMQYAEGGSGAYMGDVANALKSTFKYSNAILGYNSDTNMDSGLIEMINPNLDAECPVILAIGETRDPNSGHAVLCDGYGYESSQLYHHLNMGWYGWYDCWYNLPTVICSDADLHGTITTCIYNIFTDGKGEIISGRITNMEGRAIKDAVVTAQNGSDSYTVATNRYGIYALKGLDTNSAYTITVSKIGYDFELNEAVTGTSSDGNSVSGNKWGVNFKGYGNCDTVTIGTGTSDWAYPIHTNYHDSRTQIIYLASEIGRSGCITALAFELTAPPQTLENWTIRMKHTSMSEYDTSSLEATGWTVVYQNNESISGRGWQKFEFQTPFEYNGTDNLLVDVSYNNDSDSESSRCRVSRPGGKRSVYASSDSRCGDPLDWPTTTPPNMRWSTNVPNVKLTFCRESTVIRGDIKLTASDGEGDDHFGCSVSISGDYAIVGAYGDDNNRGSAYIFKREETGWTQQAKLTDSHNETDSYFGCSVSISGDYVIVGAESDYACIFKREGTSWTLQARLTCSSNSASDYLGPSVSISGDYAIIGTLSFAYIFKREGTSWTQQTELTVTGIVKGDSDGRLVSISGDYAIVGTCVNDSYRGSAYIFERSGANWTQQTRLTALDGAPRDYFGSSVSISGDYVIAGAPDDDDNGDGSGSTYIFKREGVSWTQQTKLIDPDGASFDYFGSSVSISGDYIIVGVPNDDDNGRNTGSVYIFKREGTSWTQQAKLTAFDRTHDYFFGTSVSISGDYVIVGAPGGTGPTCGSAYIFKRGSTSWPQ